MTDQAPELLPDLVEILRNYIPGENDDWVPIRIAEAANEIERLRALLTRPTPAERPDPDYDAAGIDDVLRETKDAAMKKLYGERPVPQMREADIPSDAEHPVNYRKAFAKIARPSDAAVAWRFRWKGTDDEWDSTTAENALPTNRSDWEIEPLGVIAIPHEAVVREALDLAVNIIMANEPGDSRAVSNEAVALAAVACGDTSELVMKVIREALALSPTVASERVSERETITSVSADRVIGELAAEQVWRPIETAPRDGTALLLTDARIKNWTQVAYWDTDYERWARDDATTLWHANRFTHWTPLPQPPDDSLVLKIGRTDEHCE